MNFGKSFIGRKNELRILKENLFFNGSNLTILLGRRGAGKTSLLNYFIKNNIEGNINLLFFEFLGMRNIKKETQINEFINEVSFKLELSIKEKEELIKTIKENNYSWRVVFNEFRKRILEIKNENNKIIIIIDEFAWLNNKGSNFSEEFGNFWNKISFEKNILCVLSGSSVSWMNKNVLKSKGSLYHKASSVIKLKSFDYLETLEYFEKHLAGFELSLESKLQYYLLTGGVPRYLDKIRPNLTISENIENIYFETNNKLEFDNLFISTFNSTKTQTHKNIVLCFQNANKLTIKEIKDKIKNKISDVSIYEALNDLEASDILFKIENIKNKNESLYMLSDLFCFYNVKMTNKNNKLDILNQSLLDKYNGFAFEIFAFLNIDFIKMKISRLGFKTTEYKFQNDKAQIDMIIDYGNKKYSIVECKFHNKKILLNNDFENALRNKRIEFEEFIKTKKRIKKYEIDYIVISIYGLEKIKNGSFGLSVFDVNLIE